MKPQDIIFIILLVFLLWKRNPLLAVWSGLLSLITSIPLFATWIFFTAERLTWYAAAFFLVAFFMQVCKLCKSRKSIA